MHPKTTPKRCHSKQKKNYSLFIHDAEGIPIQELGINDQHAYGQVEIHGLKAGQYFIKVKNDAKSVDKNANFDIKTFAEKAPIKLDDLNMQVARGLQKASQTDSKNAKQTFNKDLE